MIIDKYKRYQSDLSMVDMYPLRNDKKCACGCEKELTGRQRRWASKKCMNEAYVKFAIIKGDNDVIRSQVYKRDNGICKECNTYTDDWQADHIIEVRHGGGGCDLDNFQTLCVECHKAKTKKNFKQKKMNELIVNDKYIESFMADNFTNELKHNLDWIRVTDARFEYFMSDKDIEYTYGSGKGIRTYNSKPFNEIVSVIMDDLNDSYNTNYDICFLNRYDNEKMHLGWHADDSDEIDSDHPIAVVSFGAERDIWVKKMGHKGPLPNENKYRLKNGSLFVMPAGFQKTHLHKIPKWDRPCSTRISLTFRKYSG